MFSSMGFWYGGGHIRPYNIPERKRRCWWVWLSFCSSHTNRPLSGETCYVKSRNSQIKIIHPILHPIPSNLFPPIQKRTEGFDVSGRRTPPFWQTGWVKGVEFIYLRCVGLNHVYITYYILTRKSGWKHCWIRIWWLMISQCLDVKFSTQYCNIFQQQKTKKERTNHPQ